MKRCRLEDVDQRGVGLGGRGAIRKACWGLALSAVVLASLALVACGGGNTSESAAQSEATGTATDTDGATSEDEALQETDATAEAETQSEPESEVDSNDAGPAAAPGTGTLDLGDKVYAITVTECTFKPNGTFEVKGTADDGSTFEMTQFYLGDTWSQSDAEVDNGKIKVYTLVSSASEGAEPATVTGKRITWTQEFRTLDVAGNAFAGPARNGTVNLTCT
jgi:hypothetical protein